MHAHTHTSHHLISLNTTLAGLHQDPRWQLCYGKRNHQCIRLRCDLDKGHTKTLDGCIYTHGQTHTCKHTCHHLKSLNTTLAGLHQDPRWQLCYGKRNHQCIRLRCDLDKGHTKTLDGCIRTHRQTQTCTHTSHHLKSLNTTLAGLHQDPGWQLRSSQNKHVTRITYQSPMKLGFSLFQSIRISAWLGLFDTT
jgi:hypothetical protein